MRPTSMLALVLALFGAVHAAPQTFQVQSGFAKNLVSFHSEATIESFDGSTRRVTGSVTVDPAAPGTGAAASFQVDMASLDTGMSLRNTHMRENHLHTAKYPQSLFLLKTLTGAAPPLKAGVPARLTATGDFTAHGVARPRTLPVDVTWWPDGKASPLKKAGPLLHLVCRFDVALADHGIPRPEFLFMKVSETMQVTVDLWAVGK